MGKARRDRVGVQNQEEKSGNGRNPEIRKKNNQVNLTLPMKCMRTNFFLSLFFNRREEKSSWELSPKSLACCGNSVLCKASVEPDSSFKKVKLYRKSSWEERTERKKRQGGKIQYDPRTQEHVQWCTEMCTPWARLSAAPSARCL